MSEALSMSTCEPSTAAAMMARGAGMLAPLSCLRRFAGKAGRLAAKAGVAGVPPGILKPFLSQGCTPASGLALIHALAAGISSSTEPTSSSTRPISLAFFGLLRCPWSSTPMSACCRPSMRTVRMMPPPAGSRPRVTSGRPICEPRTSAAMRWWVARAISSPPPRAAPLMAATTGLPRVSSLRRAALISVSSSMRAWASSGPTFIMFFRSPPAKKVFLAEVSTTPVMSSFSATSRSTVSVIDFLYSSFIVLAPWFGSSIVSTTMPSESFSQPIMLVSLTALCLLVESVTGGESDPLDDGGHAHAAADAQGDQRVAAVAALQLVDHGAGDHGAGGAQRVAHGDGAAVDVQLLVRDVQVLLELQDHGGERLVDLDQVDVVEGRARRGETLLGGRRRAGQHDGGVGAAGRGGDDAGARGQARGLARLFRADEHQRGAVDDARAVAAVVDVVDLLHEVVLLQRHRVEAAHLTDAGEGGLQLGQVLQGGAGTHVLVAIE